MKVIGIADQYGDKYICEVSHEELRKVFGHSYGDSGKFPHLKVGETLDLGAGPDFRDQLASVARQAGMAIDTFNKSVPVMAQFMTRIASITPPSSEER